MTDSFYVITCTFSGYKKQFKNSTEDIFKWFAAFGLTNLPGILFLFIFSKTLFLCLETSVQSLCTNNFYILTDLSKLGKLINQNYKSLGVLDCKQQYQGEVK